jgi:small subunit ribosomal protein S21
MAAELLSVKVKGNDIIDINKALKQFKKRVMDSGHLQEYRERQEFHKPSAVNRKKKQHAIRVNYLRRMDEIKLSDV